MKVTVRQHDILIEDTNLPEKIKAEIAKEFERRRADLEQELFEIMFFGQAQEKRSGK